MYAEQCEGESAVNLSDSTRKGIIKWSPGRFFFCFFLGPSSPFQTGSDGALYHCYQVLGI